MSKVTEFIKNHPATVIVGFLVPIIALTFDALSFFGKSDKGNSITGVESIGDSSNIIIADTLNQEITFPEVQDTLEQVTTPTRSPVPIEIFKDSIEEPRVVQQNLKDKDITESTTRMSSPQEEEFTELEVEEKLITTKEYNVVGNLYTMIKGAFQDRYRPKWPLINSTTLGQLELKHKLLRSGVPNSKVTRQSKNVSIINDNGKTVLKFKIYRTCECLADIILPSSKTLITNNPQTFKLDNFRRVRVDKYDTPNAACQKRANDAFYMWKGVITLSANIDGTILMGLELENYNDSRPVSHFWYIEEVPLLLIP